MVIPGWQAQRSANEDTQRPLFLPSGEQVVRFQKIKQGANMLILAFVVNV